MLLNHFWVIQVPHPITIIIIVDYLTWLWEEWFIYILKSSPSIPTMYVRSLFSVLLRTFLQYPDVLLWLRGLSYSQTQSGAYALVLAEEEGDRRIPIIIGGVEAQSIAIKLEGLEPPRPLTHELFLNFARSFIFYDSYFLKDSIQF